jgi:hypothetical protein
MTARPRPEHAAPAGGRATFDAGSGLDGLGAFAGACAFSAIASWSAMVGAPETAVTSNASPRLRRSSRPASWASLRMRAKLRSESDSLSRPRSWKAFTRTVSLGTGSSPLATAATASRTSAKASSRVRRMPATPMVASALGPPRGAGAAAGRDAARAAGAAVAAASTASTPSAWATAAVDGGVSPRAGRSSRPRPPALLRGLHAEARELRHAEVLLVERGVDLLHDLLEAVGAHHVAVLLHALMASVTSSHGSHFLVPRVLGLHEAGERVVRVVLVAVLHEQVARRLADADADDVLAVLLQLEHQAREVGVAGEQDDRADLGTREDELHASMARRMSVAFFFALP